MKLTALIPNPEDLLALEPEELAGYLIEYFNALPPHESASISRYNFSLGHTVAEYPAHRAKECQCALMEAWSVLEREGLVAPKPEDNHGWFVITRRGRGLKNRADFASFRHSSLFPKDSIHPKLAQKVYPLFLRGDYETAIFQAFKSVEVAVREAAPSVDAKLYGVDLMRKAFHPETGPLTDKVEPVAEREALLALFAGAIGRFKNPTSHRHVPVTSPSETVETLMFASHLLRIVDDRGSSIPHAV
jgi:uncharacterized protein (TIGR02391 family)